MLRSQASASQIPYASVPSRMRRLIMCKIACDIIEALALVVVGCGALWCGRRSRGLAIVSAGWEAPICELWLMVGF